MIYYYFFFFIIYIYKKKKRIDVMIEFLLQIYIELKLIILL